MALQKSITTKHGIMCSEGYIKIVSFRGDKNETSFDVKVFFNLAARLNNKEPLVNLLFTTSTPTTDMLPALYTHLKTLPEFSGAIDV